MFHRIGFWNITFVKKLKRSLKPTVHLRNDGIEAYREKIVEIHIVVSNKDQPKSSLLPCGVLVHYHILLLLY